MNDLYFADVIFTTAHKSKGLEFDNVKLADDFLPNFDFLQSLDSKLSDNINTLYVPWKYDICDQYTIAR